jgi:hypothetical protein
MDSALAGDFDLDPVAFLQVQAGRTARMLPLSATRITVPWR